MFNLPQNQAILLQFLKPSADHNARGQCSGRRAKTSASNTSTTTTTGWELTNSSYLCLNSFLFTMKQPTCCPEQEVSVILHLEKLQKKQGWYLSFFFFFFFRFCEFLVHNACITHSTRRNHGRSYKFKWKLAKFPLFYFKVNSNNSSLKYENVGTNDRITGLSRDIWSFYLRLL